MKNYTNSLVLFKNLHRVIKQCHSNVTRNISSDNSRNGWKCSVGLEIHAQLMTKSKLFSSAPYEYGAGTNTQVNLFDAAIPGTLPVLNKSAVEMAVLSALALGCNINETSFFDRKHYFYPDMPAGYQITQQRVPLAENGAVEFAIYQPGVHAKPYYKIARIKQIQLEQDSGKSLHDSEGNSSFVDLNRAGVALIEIIFKPDLHHEDEAVGLIKEIIQILKRVQTCSGKMEEGALRVDANVSVSEDDKLGVRTEIKNISSIHGVANAIKAERERQIDLIKAGEEVKNETFMWDSVGKKVIQMRDKEDNQDYRFMPEPNLPPLRLIIRDSLEDIHKNAKSRGGVFDLRHLKSRVPSTPQQDRMNLVKEYGLSEVFAFTLVNQEKLLSYFKDIMAENSSRNPKTTYLILMVQLLHVLNLNNLEIENCKIAASHLGQIVDLIQKRRISKKTVEFLLKELVKDSNTLTPVELVEKNNLEIISNPRELRKFCLRVVEKEVVMVATYKKRKKSVLNELINKVIIETKYRADTQVLPQIMTEVLNEKLENEI
ncbi:hypothetical protein RUM43_003326 [Polyplax serrata]|uniref:Glutamyl-tRNA(Gln) amidotransferase subunit B, mitochondrial n=1 Tax=Polyplax serrata TaxID=468196 RepID=A0AAN8NZX9_POLSC